MVGSAKRHHAVYNLLIRSQVGAWDSRSYEFRAERFCQRVYTEESLRNQFHALTPEAILKLQSIPALFAYEGRASEVRVGYLRRIVDRRERNEIYIEFDFEYSIPPIPFARIEPIRVALDLGNASELNTTHWAIKDADLFRVLASAGLTQGVAGGSQLSTTSTVPAPRGGSLAREAELELLIAALRRLGAGGLRPLINRRRDRQGISIDDEYDIQDAVEVLLRALYIDVRCEEPTPSSAGSYSRMDMQVRSHGLAVEVKVTAPGRVERAVKGEILRDIHDYQGHPYVQTVVFAVYDLAETFTNASGFENDLSRKHNDVDVIVLVIPWVGPRS